MQKLKKILCFRSLHLISSSSWSHESVEKEGWRTEQETDTPAQADGQDRVLLGSDGLGAHREHDCQVSEVKILWNCEDDYFHQEPDLLHQSITWTEFTIEENMSENCWTKKLLKNSEMSDSTYQWPWGRVCRWRHRQCRRWWFGWGDTTTLRSARPR